MLVLLLMQVSFLLFEAVNSATIRIKERSNHIVVAFLGHT